MRFKPEVSFLCCALCRLQLTLLHLLLAHKNSFKRFSFLLSKLQIYVHVTEVHGQQRELQCSNMKCGSGQATAQAFGHRPLITGKRIRSQAI